MDVGRVGILIVGAGPTGLALANTLAQYGADFCLIDQNEGPSTHPKASLMTPRTVEVFERLGLLSEVEAAGVPAHGLTAYAEGQPLVRFSYENLDSPHAFALNIGQPHTEQVLIRNLETHGKRVERQTRLENITEDEDGIRVRLWDLAEDETREMKCQYLIGCDGAHSTVREYLNQDLQGKTYASDNLVGDVILDWDFSREEHFMSFTEDGYLVVYAMPDGRNLVTVQLAPLEGGKFRAAEGKKPTLKELQKIFDERSPIPGKLRDARWLSYYASHERGTRKLHRGNIFLAGDAVHLSSPLGGLGMNTGIQDAHTLGWMLAYNQRGWAGEVLLDSYQPERLAAMDLRASVSDGNEKLLAERVHLKQHVRNLAYRALSHFEPAVNTLLERNFQLRLGFRNSPGVREHLGPPALLASPHIEGYSCVNAWMHFGQGPHAGDWARDFTVRSGGGKNVRLCEILSRPGHALLAFSGLETSTDEAAMALGQFLIQSAATHQDWLSVHLVTTNLEIGEMDDDDGIRIWLDPTRSAHKRYGAFSACFYLIRPDGYVGFRSLPPDPERFAQYLRAVMEQNVAKERDPSVNL